MNSVPWSDDLVKELSNKYRELIFNNAMNLFINNNMVIDCENSYLFDTLKTQKTKVEIADLVYRDRNLDGYVFSHVKFGLDNDDMCKNIDQSIASIILLKNNNKDYFEKIKLVVTDIDNSDKIKAFELIFVIDEKGFNSLNDGGVPNINKLRDRYITKFKLLEWIWILRSEGKDFRIRFIKSEITKNNEFTNFIKLKNKYVFFKNMNNINISFEKVKKFKFHNRK